MTKAQNSYLSATAKVLQEIEFTYTPELQKHLLNLLSRADSDSNIWEIAIQSVLRNGKGVDNLLEQLSEAAADDAYTMAQIVGWDATIILLRISHRKEVEPSQVSLGLHFQP